VRDTSGPTGKSLVVERFPAKQAVSHLGKVDLPEIRSEVIDDRGYHQRNGDFPRFEDVGYFQVSNSPLRKRIETRAHRQRY
jgi:hypothetical protein